MPNRVLLKKLQIKNLGPITDDVVYFNAFTYFVGRNNAGKSHYLKAIELLLASKNPPAEEIFKLQNDKTKDIIIEGEFEGVEHYAALLAKSKHKDAIEQSIQKRVLRVGRILNSSPEVDSVFGIYNLKGELENPAGLTGNLLKILPEPISIVATADTADELVSKGNTAIMKLKKEVLSVFLEELKAKTKNAFEAVNEFLHSQEDGKRSADLISFENRLKEELTGEFADIMPSIEFDLPDEDVVAQKMKLFLDDGHRSEVEQKGHGLQRATLLALLRLLARQGERYRERPAPMFLVGELETFLHPYAQRQLAYALNRLADRYQIITTTHSPFIITPDNVEGYRRIKKSDKGTINLMPDWTDLEVGPVKRHLEWRGNLEGLFADRIILIEGNHDENFYERLRIVFDVPFPNKKFTLFVKTSGKKQLRIVRDFYTRMGFDDVAVVSDLDYLFCGDAKHLLKQLGIDPSKIDDFRKHIGWLDPKDPSLEDVLDGVRKKALDEDFDKTIKALEEKRVFVLRHGAPEQYYKDGMGRKAAWANIASEADLVETQYLKALMQGLLK
jgi:predicted ATP-dependent endonuclease of OLD family